MGLHLLIWTCIDMFSACVCSLHKLFKEAICICWPHDLSRWTRYLRLLQVWLFWVALLWIVRLVGWILSHYTVYMMKGPIELPSSPCTEHRPPIHSKYTILSLCPMGSHLLHQYRWQHWTNIRPILLDHTNPHTRCSSSSISNTWWWDPPIPLGIPGSGHSLRILPLTLRPLIPLGAPGYCNAGSDFVQTVI